MRQSIGPIFLIALLVSPQFVHGHQPGEGDPLKVDGVFTWMQWWETNRDTYLRKALKNQRLHSVVPPQPITIKVIDGLLEATHDDSRDVRAEAALALARMGHGGDRLLELTGDSDLRVSCRAWVGLGLLNKETAFFKPAKLNDAELLAVVTGLGLLDKPTVRAVDFLRTTARSAKYPEAQRMAIWALRVYHNLDLVNDEKGIDNAILVDIVSHSENPAVVSEALLAMGTIGGQKDLPLLEDVARMGPQTLSHPAFARWMQHPPMYGAEMAGITQWPMTCMRAAACLGLAQMTGSSNKPVAGISLAKAIVDAKSTTTQAVLQRDALMRGDEVIARVGNNYWCENPQFFPGISVLALNGLGDTASLVSLLQFASYPPVRAPMGTRNGQQVVQTVVDRSGFYQPQRGYAAIAMGLSGSSDWLHTYANKPDEPRHLRTACVLAMGLSDDRGNADTLMKLANKLDPKTDTLLYGYIVLALGMLHDPHTLEYASRFGLGGEKIVDVNKILRSDFDVTTHLDIRIDVPLIEDMDVVFGMRAALLGLALIGDSAAKPALLNCWGHGQWVSLEAARAMGWCGVYDSVDPMLALLKQTNQKNVQAWTARCLGEMFDLNQPSKLSRLIEGNLYVYPIKQTDGKWIDLPETPIGTQREYRAMMIEREFPGLANPLLYWQILPYVDGKFVPPWNQ